MSGSGSDGVPVSNPTASQSDAGVGILTLRDVIEHLADHRFGIAQDIEHSVLKRAARGAYRDLINAHNWRYFIREWQLILRPAYSTGTVSYDHTGGSIERKLTLAGGTFPDWAMHGRVRIGSNVYGIDRRVSGTVVELDGVLNPGADVSSTSDWEIYRNAYPLPNGFIRAQQIHSNNPWSHCYVEPEEWMRYERELRYSGKPFRWTILADDERDGGFQLRLMGFPPSTEPLAFFYQHRGEEPVLSGIEAKTFAGTVSVTGTSVTGSGTSFDASMIGAYLRVSADATTEPTSLDGLNPYVEQVKIRSVESATALTLATDSSASYSGKKYVISHRFDLEPGMINALLRGAEYQLAMLIADPRTVEARRQSYMLALRTAAEADYRTDLRMESGSKMGPQPNATYDPYTFDFGENA